MANVSFGGFRPWGTFSGGEGVFPALKVREVANNYGTAIGINDPIIPVSDGTVAVAANNSTNLLGVVVGTSYVLNGKRILNGVIPASTTFSPTTVGSQNASLVQYMPLTGDLILEVDGNAAAPTPTFAGVIGLIGENCNCATGTPDATTGMSAFTLDLSSHVTTAAQFRIVDIRANYTLTGGLHMLDNDVTVTRTKFLVVCNQGFLPPYSTSGV